ncbi:hypothetical protein HA402_004916 [Bradysia odoriphaga]|nr:hypothetical protein HA402_004916 [Bradysia odoriphaga]
MPLSEVVEELPTPLQSASDKKSYKLIRLENGLKVLMVKEPNETGLAAVALTVDIGSFKDPPEVQGLAHYLEHLVFMGSQKHAKENDFDQFIKMRCGFDNAVTEVEFTNFYFSIVEHHLSGALDRFSQFFISPLMTTDSMEREMEAVDSEFQSNINEDVYRINQIYATMVRDKHPASNFTWGNLKTLKTGIDRDKLYRIVHEFRRKFYRSNLMNVCVQSSIEHDVLQRMVVEYFADIKPEYGTIIKPMSVDAFSDVFKPEFYKKMYFVKSTAQKRKLFLTFLLPSLEKNYLDRSVEYLAYLVDYEGRNSLISYLKRQGLAVNLSAKIGNRSFEGNSMFTFFTIEVGLSKDGQENVATILKAIFSYLYLIKMTSLAKHKQIFNEFKQIKINNFNYSKEKPSIENVQTLATNMKYFADRDIVVGHKLCPDFNETVVSYMIDRINDGRFNLLILSDSYKEFNKIEPWFQTEYAEVTLPAKYTHLWNERWLNTELLLPSANKFICRIFEIYQEPTGSALDVPVLITKTEHCKCFHKLDRKYQLPLGIINIKLISSLTKQSVTNINMTTIFSMCVKNFLLENLYPARVVGYRYKISSIDSGLILLLSGFNEKLPTLLNEIMECMLGVGETTTKFMFESCRKNLRKQYYNILMNTHLLNEDCRQHIIKPNHKFYYDRFRNIEKLTVEGFKEFVKRFLISLQPRMLIQGNINREQALFIADSISKTFRCLDSKDGKNNQPPQANDVSIGTTYFKVMSMLPNDANSVIKNYYQIGDASLMLQTKLDILQKFISEPLFNTLRTQEQLGYSVSCSVKRDYKMLGFVITIESQEMKHPARLVDEKIDIFLQNFITTLQAMSDEDFDTTKNSIIALKQSDENDLISEVDRNWKEVMRGRNKFERSKLETRKMELVSKMDLIEFYAEHFVRSESVRKLSVQVLSNAGSDKEQNFLHLSIL